MANDPKDTVATKKEELSLDQQKLEVAKELLDLVKQQAEAEKKTVEELRVENQLGEEKLERLKNTNEYNEQFVENLRTKVQLQEKEKQELIKIVALKKKNGENAEKELDTLRKISEELDENKVLLEDGNEKLERYNELLHNAEKVAEKFTKKLFLVGKKDFENSWLGKMADIKKAGGGGIIAQLKEIGKEVGKIMTVQNIWAATQTKVLQSTKLLALAEDQALSSFNAATGVGGKYNNMLTELGNTHRELGLDTGDMANALKGLREDWEGFTTQTDAAKKETVLFAATLTKIGISAETTGKIMRSLTKNYGMTVAQSMKAQKEIMASAKALGISQAKMMEDAAGAMPRLIGQGDKAIQKFRELAAASKATGLAIDKLIDIAEKFDTFEGAADIVGKLNSVLGDNFLDSIEMVNEIDPTKRLKMLQQGLKASGKEFKDLGYYMQKSMAATMGTSVDELSRIMNAKDIDKYAASTKAAALEQKEINELAMKAQSVFARLEKAIMSFGISLQPVIQFIGGIVDAVMSANDKVAEWTGGVTGFIPILVGLYGALYLAKIGIIGVKVASAAAKAPVATLKGFLFGQAAAQSAVGNTGPVAAAGTKMMGTAAAITATQLLAFGAAILMVGIGIGAAVWGVSKLVEAMKGMSWGDFGRLASLLGILTVALLPLAVVAFFAAGPLKILGAALLMIGAAVALVGWGISKMMNSLTDFFKALTAAAPVLPLIAMNMSLIALSVLSMAYAAGLAVMAMPGLVLGLAGLALVFAMMGSTSMHAVKALSSLFSSLAQMSGGAGGALKAITSEIKEIVSSINQMPTEKAIAFSTVVGSVVGAGSIIRNSGTAGAVSSAVAAAVGGGGSSSGGGGRGVSGGDRPVVIHLNMDGREMKKFIVGTLNDLMNIRSTS